MSRASSTKIPPRVAQERGIQKQQIPGRSKGSQPKHIQQQLVAARLLLTHPVETGHMLAVATPLPCKPKLALRLPTTQIHAMACHALPSSQTIVYTATNDGAPAAGSRGDTACLRVSKLTASSAHIHTHKSHSSWIPQQIAHQTNYSGALHVQGENTLYQHTASCCSVVGPGSHVACA